MWSGLGGAQRCGSFGSKPREKLKHIINILFIPYTGESERSCLRNVDVEFNGVFYFYVHLSVMFVLTVAVQAVNCVRLRVK